LGYSFDAIFFIFCDGLDSVFLLFGNGFDDFFFFLGDSFYDIFSVSLKNIFDLREVSFDNLSHTAEVLQQCGNFLLQCCTEDICDFRLHQPDYALNFFLVRCILSYKGALEFHDGLNNELKLIDF
jgi:hypothetical protein